MKRIISSLSTLILFSLLLSACSSTQQTTQTKTEPKDSLYVFDKVPVDTTKPVILSKEAAPAEEAQNIQNIQTPYYLVQIGAFTSKDRAQEFVDKTQSLLNQQVKITLNPDINLFVVRLAKIYTTHDNAEKVKDNLRQQEAFKDAWVVTVDK
ncbi:MAG TPA: SPOR domain-containing protein [Ignavibacteriaceae bacterium]|nr:SPOR domain-containing protein [Ignavibacteriaceae bacterium]